MGDVLESVPGNESEADALLAAIEAPSEETPTESAPEAVEAAPVLEPTKDPFDFEDEINWRGENRKLHYSKIKQFAQQGYDYSEKMREFNSTRSVFDTEKSQFQKERDAHEKTLSAYRAVDEYAKQNPQWWSKVNDEYSKLQTEQGALTPQIPQALQSKLNKLEQYVETQEAKEKTRLEEVDRERKRADDQRLDSDINHFRQSHPDVDWTSTKEFQTPQGVVRMNLEQQVCQYMVDNKIGSFRAAARDFLWDDLQKKTEFKAKEKVGKEIQKATKFGAGTVSPTPKAKVGNNGGSPTQYSYDELVNQALNELGLT